MRALNLITLVLIIIGGLNWGLVGLFDFNLVLALFGATGLTKIIYILVGLSALWQLIPLSRSLTTNREAVRTTVPTGRV